jgi:hypothetical protein
LDASLKELIANHCAYLVVLEPTQGAATKMVLYLVGFKVGDSQAFRELIVSAHACAGA